MKLPRFMKRYDSFGHLPCSGPQSIQIQPRTQMRQLSGTWRDFRLALNVFPESDFCLVRGWIDFFMCFELAERVAWYEIGATLPSSPRVWSQTYSRKFTPST